MIGDFILGVCFGLFIFYGYWGYKTNPRCPKCHPEILVNIKKESNQHCSNCGTKLKTAKIVYE